MNKIQLKKDLRVFLFMGVLYYLVTPILKGLGGLGFDWTADMHFFQSVIFGLISAVFNHFTHIYNK